MSLIVLSRKNQPISYLASAWNPVLHGFLPKIPAYSRKNPCRIGSQGWQRRGCVRVLRAGGKCRVDWAEYYDLDELLPDQIPVDFYKYC